MLKLTKFMQQFQETEQVIDENVSIIFYPGAWHTDLRVGDKVYNIAKNSTPDITQHRYQAALRSSKQGKKGFVEFKLKVNRKEVEKIKEALKETQTHISCTKGVCNLINNNTSVRVPVPLNLLPISNSIFLGFSKFFPGSKIEKVTIEVNEPIGLVGGRGAAGLLAEGMLIASVVVLGQKYYFPIEEKEKEQKYINENNRSPGLHEPTQ